MDVYDFDIICISEFWLKLIILDFLVYLFNYIFFCYDCFIYIGGVCIFVYFKIFCVRVCDFEDLDIEFIWIKVRFFRFLREVLMILVGIVYYFFSSC